MEVLLYYWYVPLKEVQQFYLEHRQFCDQYDFKGRIIISEEGLNGTISGTLVDCAAYRHFIEQNPLFEGIQFKRDPCEQHLFTNLTIKIKPFLIKLNAGPIDPRKSTGIHLEPSQFHELMNQEDTLVLDVRSNYEHHLGKFKNAITLDIDNFYDLPEALKTHPLYLDPQNKSKKILTYCTGGVKCETASSYLQKLGFQHVYQLKGGIINYGHQMKGVDFQGSCYVFDGRITAHVNEVNPVVISKCWFCNHDCDVAVNCRNSDCDRRMTSCQHCFQIHQGCCSLKCISHGKIRKRTPNYFISGAVNKTVIST